MKKRNFLSSIMMVLLSVLMVPIAQAQSADDSSANSVTEPNYTPLDEGIVPNFDEDESSLALEPEQRWRCDRWGRDRWGRRCDPRGECDRWGRDRWGRRCRDDDRRGGSFSVSRYPISGREV